MAGKYVDLSDLLAVNLVQKDPEPQLLLDGRLVLTSQPKKQRRRIKDIASWMEAFAIFSLILVSQFPPSLERFNAVPAVDSADLSPFFWKSLACLRPSVPASTLPLLVSQIGQP